MRATHRGMAAAAATAAMALAVAGTAQAHISVSPGTAVGMVRKGPRYSLEMSGLGS